MRRFWNRLVWRHTRDNDLGHGRSRPRRKRQPFDVESLDARLLLSVTSSFGLGLLDVTSDADSDSIVITCAAGNVQVNGADPDTGAVACNAVTAIRVAGRGGDDLIDLSGVTPATYPALPAGLPVTVNGGAGNDTILGSGLEDSLLGGVGADDIQGAGSYDRIDGGAGNDILDGGDGNDTIRGGTGNDELYGQAGSDLLYGDAGADLLDGGTETDRLFGGAGNDTLDGCDGDDTLNGGLGVDTGNGGNKVSVEVIPPC